MKARATFYHAGCLVCIAPDEQQLADAIDPAQVSGGLRRDWRVKLPQPGLHCSRPLPPTPWVESRQADFDQPLITQPVAHPMES